MIEDTVKKLLEAKENYYNGLPTMSDAEFDKLEDSLRVIDPDNKYFQLVGISSREQGADIVHKYRMKSMAKGKQPEDVEKWMKNIGITDPKYSLVILPKVDGISATLRYNKGKLVYVASRGDGTTGKDISHIAKHMKDIPLTIDFTQDEIEIRGELYLSKFANHGITGPLRNNCTGLVNRQSDTSQTHHLRFVAYQVVLGGFKSVAEYLTVLSENGFNVVDAHYVTNIESIYNKYLNTLRDAWEYETDGLVAIVNDLSSYNRINSIYKDNDHHWFTNFALKPPSQGGETTLLDIEWQMSRQGNLIPVAIFEPITIGGANIQRATANNYENVRDLNLKRGDTITILRANDVIPFLDKNLGGGAGNLIPETCPHCNSILEHRGVHLTCMNENCTGQELKRLTYWIEKADIDQVGPSLIEKLYNAGVITDVASLYKLSYNDIQGIDGIGISKAEAIVKGLEKDKSITAVNLLSRLNIPLVRVKGLKKLSVDSIDTFLNFNDVSSAIGINVVEWKNKEYNMNTLTSLLDVVTIELPTEGSSNETKGYICATGKCSLGRKDLIKVIEDKGYTWSSSVTKDLSILLIDDTYSTSSKAVKARKNGGVIMLYKDFLKERFR